LQNEGDRVLLTSVVIVLREVLEAALLISILSALSGIMGISRQWLLWAFGCGFAGAVSYKLGINPVSDLFDGTGQELSSAAMQFLIYLLLVVFAFLAGRSISGRGSHGAFTVLVMAAIIALAITREGFEVLVYLFGFADEWQQSLAILTGALIGAGVGISAGALVYYLFSNMKHRYALLLGLCLLSLVAAGMISQAALLLIQADWLPAQLPLWDTSAWLAEQSITGTVLYALIGYEATPTAIQAACYFGGLLLILMVAVISARTSRQSLRGKPV
jgi:high-affinity iron transporter